MHLEMRAATDRRLRYMRRLTAVHRSRPATGGALGTRVPDHRMSDSTAFHRGRCEHGWGRTVEFHGVRRGGDAEAGAVDRNGRADRTRRGSELQDGEGRGRLSGDAGQIADRIIGIHYGITGWIDDGAQPARGVIHVADVDGKPGEDAQARQDDGCCCQQCAQPL